MWPMIQEKIREWYIVGIGLCMIAGGLFVASLPTSRSAAVNAAPAAAAALPGPTAKSISINATIAPAADASQDPISASPRNNRTAAAKTSPQAGKRWRRQPL